MYRILLAEDEKTLRDILTVFFRKNDFEIDAVENGNDACAYADCTHYDIVILDIMIRINHKTFFHQSSSGKGKCSHKQIPRSGGERRKDNRR